MKVLLVGGAGYIGSHTAVALGEAGHEVLIIDDLSSGSREAVRRVGEITGVDIPFLEADARDIDATSRFVAAHGEIGAIVLFAGLKSVAESVADPVRYYDVNVGCAVGTLELARRHGITTLVFSSSATVYGDPASLPVAETAPTGLALANPYGKTKRIIEELILDASTARADLRAVSLRYFNPVGAHESGLLGEDPRSTPTNLMPLIARVASGRRDVLDVFGDDYPTPDGTGIRDYIHVVDLAAGHVRAIEQAEPGYDVFNLGMGIGVSVYELVHAFEAASGAHVPTRVRPRRDGDVAVSFADPTKAERAWGWVATRDAATACVDYWRWQTMNPDGYATDRA